MYLHNWRKERESCSKNKKSAFLCHAKYYHTADNQIVGKSLASLPGWIYSYVLDILFVSESARVRLIQNITVFAGLVNSAMDTVVKVVYDNGNRKAVLQNKKVSPYSLICDFPNFHGFFNPSGPSSKGIFTFISYPT